MHWLLIAACSVAVSCGRAGFERYPLPGEWVESGGSTQPVVLVSDPDAAVAVTNLRVDWATPGSILWGWDAVGVAGDLFAFELVIAESMVDLTAKTGTARVVTFLRSGIPFDDALDLSIYAGVMTIEHQQNSEYFAVFLARDTAGRVSYTNVSQTFTPRVPPGELVVFSESNMPGFSLPTDFVYADGAPYQGLYHYEWPVSCATDCWENLRRQGLGLGLSLIDQTAFEQTAYIEFALAAKVSAGATAAYVRLWFTGQPSPHSSPAFAALADGAYRLYEIPLRSLSLDGQPLTHADLSTSMNEFGIGGQWGAGTSTLIDEVRIRW